MLQVDHIYEFLFENIFKDFDLYYCKGGVINTDQIDFKDIVIFTQGKRTTKKIFFYDQEPILPGITEKYIKLFRYPIGYDLEEVYKSSLDGSGPYTIAPISPEQHAINLADPDQAYKNLTTIVTSEKSHLLDDYQRSYDLKELYYFFHGFAALDWYRGYYALNYNKSPDISYNYDFITYNRIINYDRSYRIYWISKLKELALIEKGLVSFNVTDNMFDDWRDEVADPNTKLSEHARQHAERYLTNIDKLIIDQAELLGSASADIPRNTNAFWHIVTETVFYYDKLHLTEKVFKPIVCKQPFMLLAAPGNLAYLRSYGFKTFDGIIDESYDNITDHDSRVDAVAKELERYCNLPAREKMDILKEISPIVEHNFHHFYGEFKQIITQELISNTKRLFQDLNYNDQHIDYQALYQVLIK